MQPHTCSAATTECTAATHRAMSMRSLQRSATSCRACLRGAQVLNGWMDGSSYSLRGARNGAYADMAAKLRPLPVYPCYHRRNCGRAEGVQRERGMKGCLPAPNP